MSHMVVVTRPLLLLALLLSSHAIQYNQLDPLYYLISTSLGPTRTQRRQEMRNNRI